jgi:2-haloacid dehalogenase
MTAMRDVLKREITALAFDQYGTIVDMQKGSARSSA